MSSPTESSRLRALPSIDRLLRTDVAIAWRETVGLERLTSLARQVTDELRQELQHGELTQKESASDFKQNVFDQAVLKLNQYCERETLGGIRRVINATGVILHTNLGRAPLSNDARRAIAEEAAGYCTLEYDQCDGTRGKRGARVEELLRWLTGAEDALIVNNCAAAALLVLKVLASGGETIISRGELVEIGGDFRVPDVMANSGTRMVEVGTTNRTRIRDYQNAITENTRLILRVHPSNYRIIGFTDSPALVELAQFAHEANLLLYLDAGSGLLFDLSELGLSDEPVIRTSVAEGADVVTFSGDKLLGSAQAGLIVGRSVIIERLRRHPLYRALRVDKLCLAALEATLEAYARGTAASEVPTLAMLGASNLEIQSRARSLISQIHDDVPDLRMELVAGVSAIGGGCGPNVQPPTTLIALEHEKLSPDALEERLRASDPPIIARVANGKVLLDLRTVSPADEGELIASLRSLQH